MTLQEITERGARLDIYEKRESGEAYRELVFFSKDTALWEAMFIDLLGSPVKPADKEPAEEDARAADEYGGIYKGQTLFRKDFGSYAIIAMFWPWQDKQHTTLKIAIQKKG